MAKEINPREVLNFCYGQEGQFVHMRETLRDLGADPGLADPRRQTRPRVLVFGDSKAGKSHLIESLMNCVFSQPQTPEQTTVDALLTIYEGGSKRESQTLKLADFAVRLDHTC